MVDVHLGTWLDYARSNARSIGESKGLVLSVHAAPLLLSLLIGLLLGLVIREFLRSQRYEVGDTLMEMRDGFLLGLLVLAALALGVFVVYLLLGTHF